MCIWIVCEQQILCSYCSLQTAHMTAVTVLGCPYGYSCGCHVE